jgi:RNA recognition motif-containing protein
MSIRLYVGNLPKELDRQELEALFASEIGDMAATKVVTDRKTGKCRGFGFLTVETSEQADQVIEKFNGHVFKDSPLKIEVAMPRTKSKEEEATAPESSSARRSPKSKSRRSSSPATSSGSQPESNQPDPRWAQELEKLKQMLAAQTSNS